MLELAYRGFVNLRQSFASSVEVAEEQQSVFAEPVEKEPVLAVAVAVAVAAALVSSSASETECSLQLSNY